MLKDELNIEIFFCHSIWDNIFVYFFFSITLITMKWTTTKKTLRYQMQCSKYHDINSTQQKKEDWDIFLRLTCWIASERYNIQVDKNKTWHVIGDLYAQKISFVTKKRLLPYHSIEPISTRFSITKQEFFVELYHGHLKWSKT